MRNLLLSSVFILAGLPMSANAQSIGDVMNTIRAVAEMEKRNAESKKREEERVKEQELRKEEMRLQIKEIEERYNAQPSISRPANTAQSAPNQYRSINGTIVTVQGSQPISPTTSQNTAQTIPVDDGGYGAVFDQLESARLSMSDDDLFKSIESALSSNTANQSQCDSLKHLLTNNHHNATVFALHDLAKNDTRGAGNSVVKNCDVGINREQYATAANRIPSFSSDAKGLYTLAAFLGSYFFGDQFQTERKNEYLKMSADLGYAPALYSYAGYLHQTGDKKGSFIYFNKAAEQTQERSISLDSISILKKEFNYDFFSKKATTQSALITTNTNNKKATIQADNGPLFSRYVNVASLNVRDYPDGNKIGSLTYASKVSVFEKSGGWARVSNSAGTPRWVSLSHLQLSKPEPQIEKPSSRRSNDPLPQGVRKMSMSACRSAIMRGANYRGVRAEIVIDTSIAVMARVPTSRGSSTYDFVKCSRPDGIIGVERLSR